VNKSAEKLLNDGLCIRRGRLLAASVAHQRAIDRLLDAAFNHPIENIGSAVLPRPSGCRPLVLQAVPLTQTSPIESILFGLETVLLLVIDPEAECQPSQTAALRGLGLTRAEAAVAVLIGTGLKPKDASEQLKTTTATVRVHLKSIFQKLDLQGQGQLVQLVSRLAIVKD
jgi:DNA-binding CsgD family transcriptional regulator